MKEGIPAKTRGPCGPQCEGESAVEGMEAKPAGRWMTPEQYAAAAELELGYVRKLLKPSIPAKRCPKRIDERDLERFSSKRIRIFYTSPNIAGIRRPRLVNR